MHSNQPYLLNREQAAHFLGIDPKSFDRYFRAQPDFKRFRLGRHDRFTISAIKEFIEQNYV